MVVLRWTVVILLMGLALSAVLFLGVHGYRQAAAFSAALDAVPPGGSAPAGLPEPGEVRFRAENLLFLAILLAAALLLSFLAAILRSQSLSRRLDRLIELTRRGDSPPVESLRKMGLLGEKILSLHRQLNRLNEAKSLKISTLSRINRFFLDNSRLPVVIVDCKGRIEAASRSYLERKCGQGGEVVGRHLNDLDSTVPFAELLRRLREERRPIDWRQKERVSFHPIFNRNGDLANIVCGWGEEGFGDRGWREAEEAGPAEPKVARWLRRVLAGGREDGKPADRPSTAP